MGHEQPRRAAGEATEFDWAYYKKMKSRISALVPVTETLGLRKAWAATIDFTPDHLPILGPVLSADGPVAGSVVASAGGHGMMWGPAVARVAADLALARPYRCSRRDRPRSRPVRQHGRSRLAADPIALPFPSQTG